jgi:hypothetical protein
MFALAHAVWQDSNWSLPPHALMQLEVPVAQSCMQFEDDVFLCLTNRAYASGANGWSFANAGEMIVRASVARMIRNIFYALSLFDDFRQNCAARRRQRQVARY